MTPDKSILWEECFTETIKVKLPGVKQLHISACIRLLRSVDDYLVEVEAFSRRWSFSAFDSKCFSLIKVGLVEFEVCISGDKAAHQVKVLLQGCVGLKVLGVDLEECFPLVSETIRFPKDKTEPFSQELETIERFNQDVISLAERNFAVAVSETSDPAELQALKLKLLNS